MSIVKNAIRINQIKSIKLKILSILRSDLSWKLKQIPPQKNKKQNSDMDYTSHNPLHNSHTQSQIKGLSLPQKLCDAIVCHIVSTAKAEPGLLCWMTVFWIYLIVLKFFPKSMLCGLPDQSTHTRFLVYDSAFWSGFVLIIKRTLKTHLHSPVWSRPDFRESWHVAVTLLKQQQQQTHWFLKSRSGLKSFVNILTTQMEKTYVE